MKNIYAVIFDMDGLMVNTEPIWVKSTQEVFLHMGVPFPDDLVDQLIGLNDRDCRAKIIERFGAGFDYTTYRKLLQESFREHIVSEKIETKEGIFEVLEVLQKRDVKKNVSTSSAYDIAETILTRTGLAEYFNMRRIMTGDQVRRGKPNPEIYIGASVRIATNPRNCLALEDSNPGVQSAVAAGMRAIMIPDLSQPTEATKLILYRQCENLLEAMPVIEELLPDDKQNTKIKEI